MKCLIGLVVAFSLLNVGWAKKEKESLYCYQCNRTDHEPCGPESLLACHPSKDKCVTHIQKDPANGYRIRRECGLGPCGFSDEMVKRGLGMDHCDTSRDDFFCVFCCEENGCNRDGAHNLINSPIVMIISVLVALLLSRV